MNYESKIEIKRMMKGSERLKLYQKCGIKLDYRLLAQMIEHLDEIIPESMSDIEVISLLFL